MFKRLLPAGNWVSDQAIIDALGRIGIAPSVGAGNLALSMAGSAVPVALAAQACSRVTIANNSGTTIEVQQDAAGAYFPIFTGTSFTFKGLTNASQLAARRVDLAATVTAASARWEA